MKTLLTLFTMLVFTASIAQNQVFNELLDYYSTEKNFNGAVLVATDGNIDFLISSGIGNRQSNTQLNTKSKFKIASVTKVFTAVLVMKLVEEGKINLDQTIGKYFPEYTGEGRDQVKIRHLLTYSSGIENQLDDKGMMPYQTHQSLDDFIQSYCSGKLVSVPGEQSAYGNTEYILLHKIIEKVSQMSYAEYLDEVILKPINASNTAMIASNEIVTGLVPSYLKDDSLNLFYNDDPYYPECYFGAGGLYSTVEDLLKFDQALFQEKLLNSRSTKELLTISPELGYTAFGLWGSTGWGNFQETFYYRTGSILGANANWIHTIDSKKTIIVLSNTNATNLYEFSEQLYLISIGKEVEIPKTTESTSEDESNLEQLAGTWKLDLRPTPDSEPYYQDFTITELEGKGFSGVFYGSEFSNGLINDYWDKIYFAFTTSDSNNTYYHSGYFSGNEIFGTSYSEERKFISYWQGTRK